MSVYSTLKVFDFPGKVASMPRENPLILPPIHIRLKPTNVCNHDCSYCAYRVDNLQLGADMVERDSIPRAKILELVEDFAELGVKAVTFSGGGEPFLYPHLVETCEGLVRHGIKFASLSNGALVKGRAAEIFSRHATWLRISIDGFDGPSYAKYRHVSEEEFGKVMRNIENFQKLGGTCFLGVSYNIDRNNCEHVFEMASRLKGLGVRSVKLSPVVMGNTAQQNNDYHQPIFEATKEQCHRAKAELSDAGFEINDSYHLLENKFAKNYHWCPSIQIKTVIGADQNVYSCQDKAYNLESGLIGSIKDRRFKDFWMTDKEKFFCIDPSKECNHHCVVAAQNELMLNFLDIDRNHLEFI